MRSEKLNRAMSGQTLFTEMTGLFAGGDGGGLTLSAMTGISATNLCSSVEPVHIDHYNVYQGKTNRGFALSFYI